MLLRELFRPVWKQKSQATSHTPKVAAETIALMREMAMKKRLWGKAELFATEPAFTRTQPLLLNFL